MTLFYNYQHYLHFSCSAYHLKVIGSYIMRVVLHMCSGILEWSNSFMKCMSYCEAMASLEMQNKFVKKATVVSHIYAYDRAKTLSFILLI